MHAPDAPDNKDFTREFGNHVSIVMLAMFSISTTAQVFSRKIGSTGGWFLGLYFVAAQFAFVLYGQIKTAVLGQPDAIPMEFTLGISLVWFALHGIVRAWHQSRGREAHSQDPGTGIFCRFYPALPPWLSTLISDGCVAVILALLFDVSDSPVQRDWFVWMVLPSLVITQAWVQSRQRFIKQRFIDASAEANHYSDTIGRR